MTSAVSGPTSRSPALPLAVLRRQLATALLAALGNYGCAWVGYALAIRPSGVAIVWPGSGYLLALLVLLERRYWVAALVGAFLGNVTGDLRHGTALGVALAGSTANIIEGFVAASVLVRLVGPRITLGTLREVGAFIIGAAILSNAATALLGAAVLSYTGHAFWAGWFVWWTGDGMGMLMVAPVILTWAHVATSRKRLRLGPALETAFVCLAIVAIGVVTHPGRGGLYAVVNDDPYLLFLLLFWSAVRLGPAAAATATLVLCGVTEWNVAHAVGPFAQAGQSAMSQVFAIYLYLALAGLSSLIPATMLSERRVVEARLRESEQRFRQMAEHIKEAFFVEDLVTDRPVYVSPTWSEIWGRPIAAGYDPAVWRDAVHPDDRAAMAASHAMIRSGQPSITLSRVVRPDGATRWVRSRAFPVRDRSGTVYRLVGVAEDVTALRQVEEQFAQAQKLEAVGQLAGGIAHDFNNLLTVILGYGDILLADLKPGDKRYEELEAMQKAATSAAQLTRQLLLFSRKEVQHPEVVQFNDLIAGVGKMLKRLIGETIELAITLDPQVGAVTVDRGSMEQVIVNLVVNARDAMPRGGKLVIASANADIGEDDATRPLPCEPGRYVTLVVRDTGTGMDEQTKARVFEPFFTTKGQGKGTGLGLATVYGIVQQSGGCIAIDTEPGKGTTFTIHLPRVEGSVSAARPAGEAAAHARGVETILLAEDEPAVRSLVRRVLTALGYNVLEAPDGEQALALASMYRGPIHLLLTDVVMPRMTGRILADHFAKLHPDTRVLYMSGYTDDAVVHHGVLSAEMQYVEKPVLPSALAAKVRQVLDGPRHPVAP